MLVNLVAAWKEGVLPNIVSENKKTQGLCVAQSSFQFDTPPNVIFAKDLKSLAPATQYQDLLPVDLLPEEKVIYQQGFTRLSANKNFYNGNQMLLTGAVYDTDNNTLFLEAARVDYVFIVALEEMKKANIPGSALNKEFFKTGVLAPFLSKDNKVPLVTRKDKWNLRSVAAGFLECEDSHHSLVNLIETTAIKEAEEEFILGKTGLRRLAMVESPTIASISFRSILGTNMIPTIEFVAPILMQNDADFILDVMNHNEAAHAHEHVSGSAALIPVEGSERGKADEFLQKKLPGNFLYAPVLHACAIQANTDSMLFSHRLPNVANSRFYPIGIFKPHIRDLLGRRNRCFPAKDNNSTISIELISDPNEIDKIASRSVLVESFIGEYQKYLPPNAISDDLTSWRDGDKSVRKYYEDYFCTEFSDFSHGELHYWVEARISGKLAGWATFKREESEPNAVYMNLLIVHPGFQQKGIGSDSSR